MQKKNRKTKINFKPLKSKLQRQTRLRINNINYNNNLHYIITDIYVHTSLNCRYIMSFNYKIITSSYSIIVLNSG